MNAYVPMDDEHTLQWEVFYRTDGPARPQRVVPINRTSENQDSGRGGYQHPAPGPRRHQPRPRTRR